MDVLVSYLASHTDLQAKFFVEQEEKVSAIEKLNTSQHQLSILEMDVKNSREETSRLSKELEVVMGKVCQTHFLDNLTLSHPYR